MIQKLLFSAFFSYFKVLHSFDLNQQIKGSSLESSFAEGLKSIVCQKVSFALMAFLFEVPAYPNLSVSCSSLAVVTYQGIVVDGLSSILPIDPTFCKEYINDILGALVKRLNSVIFWEIIHINRVQIDLRIPGFQVMFIYYPSSYQELDIA